MTDPWVWFLAGVLWWLASLAVALPFRCRVRPWIRRLRLTAGLPLVLGAMVEAARSRGRGSRAARHPYRGFAPFLWAFIAAEVIAIVLGLLIRVLV